MLLLLRPLTTQRLGRSALLIQRGLASSALETTTQPVDFPKMPRAIQALVHRDWNALNPNGEKLVAQISKLSPAMQFPHARDSFASHLIGSFSLLAAWGQPPVICRTGLLHTAYSGDLFQFYLFRADNKEHRQQVRDMVGPEAEELTWLFGTINRSRLASFGQVVDRKVELASPVQKWQETEHRTCGTMQVSAEQTAAILMVTVADYMDQMVHQNGWRDHHQVENPSMLYPGDGRPAVAFYWFTTVCNAIRDHLEVIPPMFDYCTRIISYQDETTARDAYWHVVIHEAELSEEEQIDLLQQSIDGNPFIGEPHILLAQIYFRQECYHDAAVHAAQGLEKFYVLATAWDKRRPFEAWVGFARVLLLRSNRSLQGLESLPMDYSDVSAQDRPLVSVNRILEEMNDVVTD